MQKIERHPGPFFGPDAELARACAMAVIEWYGSDDEVTLDRIRKDGIWNDHVAVQAALAAIHHFHQTGLTPEQLKKENDRLRERARLLEYHLAQAVAYADADARREGMPDDKQASRLVASEISADGEVHTEFDVKGARSALKAEGR